MADVSMKDFLTQYFMHRVFNAMSDEQFAQYQDVIKKKDFIGNMKDWKETWHLVKEEPAGSGKWEKNEDDLNLAEFGLDARNPDAGKEWEKLYKELRKAFRKVAQNRDSLDAKDDKKTLEFLDAFYGFGQLFSPAELTGAAADQLNNELLPFLKNNKTSLYQALKDIGIYTDTEQKFSDFINDLSKGKHNTNNEVRETLSHIIGYLQSSYYAPAIVERMGGNVTIPNLDILANGLENDPVDARKLQNFKDNYKLILNPIYREKNIYQNFGSHLKSVKDAIETAKKRVDYNNPDSKDFLTEKRPDEKGWVEKKVDAVKDWWSDHTDKYVSLHKSRLFYSDEAKAIAKAIDGSKFKPTDGLDKFVDSLKEIGGKVKGNNAKLHFKWFADTLTKLQSDKQMKFIFAGALKNPRKLKELAAEIALQGIKDGKKDEEIFTAMEVLKTIQYGYVTSNHLNTAIKQDFSLFSDKNLSWNKTEGLNFITSGIDKTIGFALKGTAVAFTVGYNIINRNIGNKFGGKLSKRTQAAFNARQADLARQADAKRAEKDLLDKMDRENRRNATREKNATGITQRTLGREQRTLAALRTDEENKKTALDAAFASLGTAEENYNNADSSFRAADDALNNLNSIIQAQADRQTKFGDIQTQITDLDTQITSIEAKGNAATPVELAQLSIMLDKRDKLKQQLVTLQQEIIANIPAVNNANAGMTNAQLVRNNADIARTNADTARINAQNAHNQAQSEYDIASHIANDLDTRIAKFTAATEQIKVAKERLKKRQEAFDKWQTEDKARFARLMAHWDFLNSGRMRTGENVFQQALEGILPLSQEARQKRYDKKRQGVHDAFVANYQSRYGLVA